MNVLLCSSRRPREIGVSTRAADLVVSYAWHIIQPRIHTAEHIFYAPALARALG
jgi:hypothetical protein